MIRKVRLILPLLLMFFPVGGLRAQFFSAGNDPARVKWSQIQSEHFSLIYPAGSDSLARVYLSRLEYFRPLSFETIHIEGKRIPVIIHSHTTTSNGVVTWAPKRIDLYSSPDPYGGIPDPWTDQLASHELRHQAQMELMSTGVAKVLYYPFGESISGVCAALYAGTPFLEGDAVVTETELLSGGRGRNASFSQYYRTAWLNGDIRNRYRYFGGSFRHYTPNKYAYGYYFISGFRRFSDDPDFQGNDMRSRLKHWIDIPHMFSHYKKTFGISSNAAWDSTVTFMTEYWRRDLQLRGTPDSAVQLSRSKSRYHRNYTSPVYVSLPDSKYYGHVIAIKSGMDFSPAMISIDSDGKEHYIRPFARTHSNLDISADSRIYWSEMVSRSGSTLEDFSVIKYLDLRTGDTHGIPHRRTKWFNPSVSPDAGLMAVTEYPITGSSFLILLDTRSWQVTGRTEAPEKGQLKESVITPEGVFSTVILNGGLALYRYCGGEWEEVIPRQHQSISQLRYRDGRIFFSSDLDGVLNIYAYDSKDNSVMKVTNSLYGAEYPFLSPADSSLYFSDFGTLGYRAVRLSADSLRCDTADFSRPADFILAEMLTRQRTEKSAMAPDSSSVHNYRDTAAYPARKYSKFTHLFRIHSWAPFYYNVDNILNLSYERYYDAASLGAVVYSQNSLGTAVTMLGYSAHTSTHTGGSKWFHSGHARFSYKGLCPFLEMSVDFNDRHRYRYEEPNPYYEGVYVNNSHTFMLTDTYPMFVETNLRLYYPIYFTSGGWSRVLIPQAQWMFRNDIYVTPNGSEIYKNQVSAALTYSQVTPATTSQLYPRWGFSLTAMGSFVPRCSDTFGTLSYLHGYLYLPGITHTQGIRLTASYQRQYVNREQYLLSSQASLPYGYSYFYPTEDYLKCTAHYAIPIYLGDVFLGSGLGLYLKRLQVIPFCEWARDFGRTGITRVFSNIGGDCLLDFSLLPFASTISVGLRYAYTGPQQIWTRTEMKDLNRNYLQFLFNITL